MINMKILTTGSLCGLARSFAFWAIPALVLDFSCYSHAACYPLPPSAVAWWPGNGDATDMLGLNNATFFNGAAFGTGEVGQAFSFSGGSNYVKAPASATL